MRYYDMLDYRIYTFLELCSTMNYRKAAENLNMTQPGVTQHIHSLEAYYGCKLFIYDRHTLKMTPEAQRLKSHIESMRFAEKKLIDSMQKSEEIVLNIGVTKTIGEYVIGKHIASFLKVKENRISVDISNTEELSEKLRNGDIDFALIEGSFERSEFDSRLYRTEPFVGICSADHPFAGRSVSPEELVTENLLIRENGSGTRKILEAVLEHKNLSIDMFPRVTTVNNFGLITSLLEQNTGITFGYEAVCRSSPRLAQFSLAEINTQHDFVYIFLHNKQAENMVEYFDSFRNSACSGE